MPQLRVRIEGKNAMASERSGESKGRRRSENKMRKAIWLFLWVSEMRPRKKASRISAIANFIVARLKHVTQNANEGKDTLTVEVRCIFARGERQNQAQPTQRGIKTFFFFSFPCLHFDRFFGLMRLDDECIRKGC